MKVINNQDLFGVAANLSVINTIGQAAYDKKSTNLMVSLAAADMQTISKKNGDIPTETDIDSYQFKLYNDFDIPATAFGGAARRASSK